MDVVRHRLHDHLAYTVSLMIYQFGGLLTGALSFGVGTVAAIVVLIGYLYLLFRRPAKPDSTAHLNQMSVQAN